MAPKTLSIAPELFEIYEIDLLNLAQMEGDCPTTAKLMQHPALRVTGAVVCHTKISAHHISNCDPISGFLPANILRVSDSKPQHLGILVCI